jgi:hypothetical protein
MERKQLIQKEFTISTAEYDLGMWRCLVSEVGGSSTSLQQGESKDEVESMAKIFVKSWNILKTTNAMLIEVLPIGE